MNGVLARDIELHDDDLDRIARLMHQSSGIVLARHKREMIYGRLVNRVRQLGCTRFCDYLDRLERDQRGEERERFVNALTTNLTAFYREAHHFDLLAEHLAGRRGPVRVWTNAVSTGEEAYSLAMTLRLTLGAQADVRVLGSDIDTDALNKAKAGVYPLAQVLKHESRHITRFFLKGRGRQARLAKVKPELEAMVDFACINLVANDWKTPGAPFDAIFCRNVMIYFDKETQARILSRFVPLLKPDGLLFAGHSEHFSYISDQFQLLGRTVYTLAPQTLKNSPRMPITGTET